MSKFNNELNFSMLDNKPRAIIFPYQCRICGAPAKYSYFGVISCDSCKIFFRRNAERERVSKYFNIFTLLCVFYVYLVII